MARLRNTRTGSIVNVPDEKVASVSAVGYYEAADKASQSAVKAAAVPAKKQARKAPARKAPAKKAAPKKALSSADVGVPSGDEAQQAADQSEK